MEAKRNESYWYNESEYEMEVGLPNQGHKNGEATIHGDQLFTDTLLLTSWGLITFVAGMTK